MGSVKKEEVISLNAPEKKNPIDYSRKWHTLGAVGTGVFLATLDSSIINVSLPTLVRSLHTDFSSVQWVVLSYLLTITTTMLSFGRVADILGKKKIYMAGFAIFTAGSALCGLSSDIHWLILFRVIQALGAAMIMALGPAIVTESFPPSERGKAMGTIGGIVSLGIIMGPALGGGILALFSWRWIFYVNLPVGIIGTLMVKRNVPNFSPTKGQRFDYRGAFSLFLFLFLLLMGLTIGQQSGFFTAYCISMLIFSFIFLAIFLYIERRADFPMVDLGIFGSGLFFTNLVNGFISFVCLGGVLIMMPFYLENILHLKTLYVGLLMGVIPLMLGIISPVAGVLSDRIGSRPLTFLGLFVLMIGYFTASTLELDTSPYGYIARIFPIGVGMGIFISPNNSAIMGRAGHHQLGVVSGLMAITRTLGQTVGVAVMGAIWAGRTLAYAGASFEKGASSAPLDAQIRGLNEMLLSAAFLASLAVVLSVFPLFIKFYDKIRQRI